MDFLKNKLGKIFLITCLITIILVIIALLKYFQIISLPQLNLFSKLSSNVTQPSQQLTLTCPVPKEFCANKLFTKYRNNPAIVYKIPPGLEIKSILPAVEYRDFAAFFNEIPVKGIYQTYSLVQDCYTVIYTFPDDIKYQPITSLALENNSSIATSGQKLLDLSDQIQTNVVVQIRKLSQDKLAETSDQKKCTIENLKQLDFGEYLDLSNLL